MDAWEKNDESIGAISDGKYRSDMLKEAKEIFATSINDKETNQNILNAIFMADVGRQLNGLEYYNYIKKINSQVGELNGIKTRFSFFKSSQGLDAVTILKYDGKYAAYSETYGKIVTNNRQQMIQYLRSINVSNADIERLV